MTYIAPPASLPPGSRVWAYLRDSGGPSQGESIDRQRVEIQTYCIQYHLLLARIFQDEARSGGSVAGREAFDDLLSACARPDHPAGLLLWDYARFARSIDDSGYYKASLRRGGVVIHSITDPIPEGPYGRMVELVIDISNEEKRRQVSKDTASGLRRIVEQYGAMPGAVPFGYTKEPINAGTRRDGSPHILHRWVPDPEKAALVLRAFELRAEGATLAKIRAETHIYSSKNSYTTFFNNAVYKGDYLFSGKVYPVQPIVPPDLWERVQQMGELRGRDRYSRSRQRRNSSPYILSGLAYCAHCGAPLNGYQIRWGRHYYVCSRARRRGDCTARHIPAQALENGITHELITRLCTYENLLKMRAAWLDNLRRTSSERDQQRAGLLKRQQANQRKINHYVRAIGESGHSRSILDALASAELERNQITLELEMLPETPPDPEPGLSDLRRLADQFPLWMQSDDPASVRHALSLILSRALISRDDGQITAIIEYRYPEETNIPP